jgi:Siphovirus Gp157
VLRVDNEISPVHDAMMVEHLSQETHARTQPRTRLGSALHAWDEAVETVEGLYLLHSGEITDETDLAESWEQRASEDLLKDLARFVRFLEDSIESIARERERLDAAERRIDARLTWARAKILQVLDRVGRKSMAAGPYRISTRARAPSLQIGVEFALDEAPDEITRTIPEVEAKRVLDKDAAKRLLKRGVAIPGLELVSSGRTVKVE